MEKENSLPTGPADTRDGQPRSPLALSEFERAAAKGDRDSAVVAAQVRARRAETREALGNWKDALEEWTRALDWAEGASAGVMGKRAEKGQRARLAARLEALRGDALYSRAVSLYMLSQFEEAAAVLEKGPEQDVGERGRVLLGLALARQAAGSWDGAAWRRVLRELSLVEPSGAYMPREGRNEQVFFAKGAAELAGLYRLGLPGLLARDVGYARQVLAAAAAKVSLPDVRIWLERELGRYQKRESGGYGYQ